MDLPAGALRDATPCRAPVEVYVLSFTRPRYAHVAHERYCNGMCDQAIVRLEEQWRTPLLAMPLKRLSQPVRRAGAPYPPGSGR